MRRSAIITVWASLILLICLSGCALSADAMPPTPALPLSQTTIANPTQKIPAQPTPQATSQPAVTLRIAPGVPPALREALDLPAGVRLFQPGEKTGLTLRPLAADETAPAETTWVYALVAPFPTLADGVRWRELERAWQGKPPVVFADSPLLMSAETRVALEAAWGAPAPNAVTVLTEDALLETAWNTQNAWAIVPFEALTPRWKVLAIDGHSPLQKDLDLTAYPLALRFGLVGSPVFDLPPANWQPEKITVLAMTGVTALVRQTAERIESQGVTYPAREIGALLRAADLTHISNEVPFVTGCPAPERRDPNFCSPPGYLALLREVGADVIELTGNHVMDWSAQPLLDTLEMYANEGWGVFGGGKDASAARAALLVEDHGNRLAFIGCNAAGPEAAWATAELPGSAKCDFDWLAGEIARLKAADYIVIATFQHVEVCQMQPHLAQQADFGKLIAAGADIVSGSQAHCPQAMAFTGDQFIHYGLGNLFFDQMDEVARRQFIDRYTIFDGRVISISLVTTQLEDYAVPTPMNAAGRQKLLEDVFRASGWRK